MLKRLLSLVLAMVLLFTAAVPVASAEDLTINPSLPRNTNEYTLELKPGETKKIEVAYGGLGPADLTRERVVVPASSSNNLVATATLDAWSDNSNEYVLKDYVTITVQAHNVCDTATITGTTVSEGRSAVIDESGAITYDSYYSYKADDWVVHVTVKNPLNPPKVEVRLVPDSTVMQVTGVHQAVDFLDTALDLLDPIGFAGKAIEKIIPQSSKVVEAVTGTKSIVDIVKKADSDIVPTYREQVKIDRGSKKYTASRRIRLFYYTFTLGNKYKSLYLPFLPKPQTIRRLVPALLKAARGLIIGQSALWLLSHVKVPRLEPEVYLEVVVTNPDNTVPLYYDMNFDSPRVTNRSSLCVPHGPFVVPPSTTDAYSEQVIRPGSEYRNVHKFILEPEWVFNDANYDLQMSTSSSYSSNITISGSWGEWKGIDGKEPGGSYAESVELNVVSTLGPQSEYQQMERFFSDIATHVFNVLEYVSQLSLSAQPANSDQAWVELLDSLPEGAVLMTPVDQLPPSPVISAPGSNP